MPNLGNRARSARRAAERRINALKEAVKSGYYSQSEKEAMNNTIKQMQKDIRQTRQFTTTGKKIGNRTIESREAAIARLNELNKQTFTTREFRRELRQLKADVGRRNMIAKQQLNLASSTVSLEASRSGNKIGEYSFVEKGIFFKATQRAWNRADVSENERIEAILKFYGTQDLEQLIKDVLEANRDVLNTYNRMDRELAFSELTEEELDAYAQLLAADSTDEDSTSPTYLYEVKDYVRS